MEPGLLTRKGRILSGSAKLTREVTRWSQDYKLGKEESYLVQPILPGRLPGRARFATWKGRIQPIIPGRFSVGARISI